MTAATATLPIEGKNTPILWWSAVGAFFVALQLYVYGAWISSEHFRPTLPGSSELHWFSKLELFVIQLGAPLLFLLVAAWFIRSTVRHKHMPSVGLIVLGWTSVIWQDPLINYVRPSFSYNSHFVNFGSWSELVPGWLSPNGSRMPEPIFFDCGAYMVVIPMTVIGCAFAMRTVKRLRPSTGSWGLILTAFVTMFFADLFAEGFLVRTGMYGYMGSIHALSLWPGNWYQFPLYESVLGGAITAAVGAMYYFRDDKGNMLVERGLENLSWKRGTWALRILSVCGFVNVVVMTYTILYVQLNLHLDPWPTHVPSYLRNGICGESSSVPCPGPNEPIYVRAR